MSHLNAAHQTGTEKVNRSPGQAALPLSFFPVKKGTLECKI